ncbi:MAG TPA: hypothetical protein VJ754_02640, partial [Anaerolineae bacterium]|nr:hypothetical protein [Anaerolineae bacterium]
MSFDRKQWLSIVVISAGLVATLTAAFWAYTQDDVYITYTYSRNIAEGQGFVFNPGERVQGTTTPLYALLMSIVYRLTTDLLHAGNLLSAVFLFIACLLSLSLLRDFLSAYGRAAVVFLQVTSPLVYVSFGMETLFYCSVLMLSFWLWSRERRPAAMLTAAALTWTRADGLVLGGTLWLLAAVEAWRSRRYAHPLFRLRAIPWRLGLIYLAAIAPWFVFAWLHFGTLLPNTFSAKQQLFSGLGFLEEGLTWWRAFYGNNPFTLLAIPLAGLGIWRATHRGQPRLRPVAVWTVLYLAGYTALNVNAFWYFTPLVAMLIILTVLGGEWFTQQMIGLRWSRRVVLAAALAIVIATTGLGMASALSYAVPPGRVETYRLIGQWIEQNTRPDQSILVGDLGIVGYHARRRTRDVPGLITPDMHFKLDSYGVAKYKLDYVVATRYFTWLRVQEQDWFRYHYAPLTQISSPGDEFSPMTVYRRRMPVEIPTQMIEGFDLPLTCSVDLRPDERLPPDTRA